MKKTVFVVFVLAAAIQTVGFSQKYSKQAKVKADTLSVDSTEYRLIVFDPGFELWLAMKPPRDFHSKDFYEQKNRLYVTEWNNRYRSTQNHNLYESAINYDPRTDYGLDLNYKLYYYFKYFEETNGVRLYPPNQ